MSAPGKSSLVLWQRWLLRLALLLLTWGFVELGVWAGPRGLNNTCAGIEYLVRARLEKP